MLCEFQNVVALSGYSEFVLIDLVTGNLLAEHSLPCHPTAPLIVGDFDNDGINDVVVTCSLGYVMNKFLLLSILIFTQVEKKNPIS
jgi:hypothetical protein